jgi:hypothetical protein
MIITYYDIENGITVRRQKNVTNQTIDGRGKCESCRQWYNMEELHAIDFGDGVILFWCEKPSCKNQHSSKLKG